MMIYIEIYATTKRRRTNCTHFQVLYHEVFYVYFYSVYKRLLYYLKSILMFKSLGSV